MLKNVFKFWFLLPNGDRERANFIFQAPLLDDQFEVVIGVQVWPRLMEHALVPVEILKKYIMLHLHPFDLIALLTSQFFFGICLIPSHSSAEMCGAIGARAMTAAPRQRWYSKDKRAKHIFEKMHV